MSVNTQGYRSEDFRCPKALGKKMHAKGEKVEGIIHNAKHLTLGAVAFVLVSDLRNAGSEGRSELRTVC